MFAVSLASVLPAADAPKPSDAVEAAAPVLAWGRQWGTAAEDFGRSLVVSPRGWCCVGGSTGGDLAAKNAGLDDVLVAAFDPSGGRLWAVQFGSPERDCAMSLALAPNGGVYVGGVTAGRLAGTAQGGTDLFVAKLAADGAIEWLRQFGSPANDACAAVVSDAAGNVFVTGTTDGRLGEKQFGAADAFLLKISPTGELLWARQWGSDAADAAGGVAIDAAGALYVTGSTAGSLDGSANAGETDLFVSKFDGAGVLQWSRQFGTPTHDQGMNLRVDARGALYVGGSSGGAFAGAQTGQGDAILLKLSPAGALVWKRQFGTANWDGVHGVALSADDQQNVIVAGCQNWPKCQAFLRAFDPEGRELWSTTVPTGQAVCGTQIAVLPDGGIYQTGGTHGPAFGDYQGSGNDLVLVRLRPANTPAASQPPAASATPQPTGPYFGQPSPGRTPQVFAPGILSRADRMEARIAFSADGCECFFTVPADFSFSQVLLYHTRCVNGTWTPQVVAPFVAPGSNAAQPFFAADGRRLFFTSNTQGSADIWVVERTGDGWGTPRVLAAPLNSPSASEAEYSQADDGTGYFESTRKSGSGQVGLWRVQPATDDRQPAQVEFLGPAFATGHYDADPFISRDGRQLIFSSGRPGGAGKADLYAAFADEHGRWSDPVNLNQYCPDINTDAVEYGPSLSADGRFLFFVRLAPEKKQCDVWWVENPLVSVDRR